MNGSIHGIKRVVDLKKTKKAKKSVNKIGCKCGKNWLFYLFILHFRKFKTSTFPNIEFSNHEPNKRTLNFWTQVSKTLTFPPKINSWYYGYILMLVLYVSWKNWKKEERRKQSKNPFLTASITKHLDLFFFDKF